MNAFAQGAATGMTGYQLGASWFIPTYFVPVLWVSQALIFVLLLRRKPLAVTSRGTAG